ncbi:hypothetical protein BFP77_08300 [Maribacter sp. 4U21]|uniref:hypothetical protein n=1 Tax=Maribacter sp. 4U21 TaxID=1889779 RepID=UPI000C1470C9|nr:hypothetical protein [Maribacter sp. 4U21]PIB28908.1 hypothetical protein BFP77_08300 [Maribacter sp. 4U21]
MTKTELKTARENFEARSKYIKEATLAGLSTKEESTGDQEKRIARLLKPNNYNEFFDYYFGVNTPTPLADAPCAKFHQSSYVKVFKDPFIVQFRRWFRGAAKSIHTNVGNMLHLKQNDLLYFALLIGRNEKAAKLLLGDIQAHLENNERIIKDFGVQMQHGSWEGGQFETNDGRNFLGLGLNQPFRGLRVGQYRPDFASVDDCEDRKEAKNQELIQEKVEKITGDLKKAFHLHRGRLIIPNNYIVKNGLNDQLLAKFKGSSHLHVQTVNLRNKNGFPSWDERYTPQMVDDIDADTDYYTSQREDYNNPIEEGKLFKREWIRFRKVPKDVRWSAFIGFWDLSYKASGDHKAYWLLGVTQQQIFALDVFCRKCELTEAINWHYDKAIERNKKGMSALEYFDATAAQEVVFLPIFQQEAQRRGFFQIPMSDVAPGVDKHLRIEATLTSVLFNGTLVFADYLEGTADMNAALEQILSFEKGTKSPDDSPDALENGVRKAQLYFTADLGSWGKPIIHQHKRGGF